MPAFNAASFIEEAVGSVISQSMPDWELLIVDDGSTDATPKILDDLAASDPRIRVWHTANRGMSEARNLALSNVKGRFLAFLDADDILHPDFLRLMLEAAAISHAQILIGNAIWYKNEMEFPSISAIHPESITILPAEKAVEDALYQKKYDNAVWGKLYDASLWKSLRFRPGIGYEDLDLFYRLWLSVDSIASVEIPLYGYRQHPASYMHTFSLRRADSLAVADRLVDAISSHSPLLARAAEVRRFAAYANILFLIYANRALPEARELQIKCSHVVASLAPSVRTNPNARLRDRLGAFAISIFGPKILNPLSRLRKRSN